ncbi:MAG: 4Fe-4S binding protein, partial [Ruminococcus sp.]|nr:4Fe-4S binding protein [Ruminococcus sp.]
QKTSSGIIAFTFDDVAAMNQSNCIHCGKCMSVCPSNLVPQMLCKALKENDTDRFESLGGMECVQCGCCSYVCPAKIPLTGMFIMGKAEVKSKAKRNGGAK